MHLEHGPRVPADRLVGGLEEVAAGVRLLVGGGDAVGGGPGAAGLLEGAALGGLASYVQLFQPLGEAVRVDPPPVGPAHRVRPPVGLAAESVEDVLQRAVVHLVLVEQLLLADALRFALQLVDHRLLRFRDAQLASSQSVYFIRAYEKKKYSKRREKRKSVAMKFVSKRCKIREFVLFSYDSKKKLTTVVKKIKKN